MKELALFEFEIIGDNEPMKNDPFYTWLEAQNVRVQSHVDAIRKYLESLGFVIKKHRITEENFKRLKLIHQGYMSMWVPKKEVFSFSDLFELSERKATHYDAEIFMNSGFMVYGSGKDKRYKATKQLLEIIEYFTPIYAFNSYNYHFEVINGYLFLKYQYILGSRRLCKIK